MKQKVAFKVFLVEQVEETVFNRGKLLNVGYDLLRKSEQPSEHDENSETEDLNQKFECIIMHDVDLILTDETISYQCNTMFPTDLASKVHPVKWDRNYSAFKNVGATASIGSFLRFYE